MSAEECFDLMTHPGWHTEGSCYRPRNPQPKAWFPEEPLLDPNSTDEEVEEAWDLYEIQVAQAKLVCSNCPVRETCEWEGRFEEYGIWGGLTRDERFEKYGEP